MLSMQSIRRSLYGRKHREKTYFMVEMAGGYFAEGWRTYPSIQSVVDDESFVAEAAEWFPDVIYFEAEVIT